MLPPGSRLDWALIQKRLTQFPQLQQVVRRETTAGRQVGSHPVMAEWLNRGTSKSLERCQAVEADLAVLATKPTPGYDRLTTRLATGNRNDVFAMLAELFVAAWYLRSGREVLEVHADNRQGDVVLRDGTNRAHLEVMDLWAPEKHYSWHDGWSELTSRLRAMQLPHRVELRGVTDLHYVVPEGGEWPEPIWAESLTQNDIDSVCAQVLRAGARARPYSFNPLSSKYPDLEVELTDGEPGVVDASWGSSGRNYPPQGIADRILAKAAPRADGRKVLAVEISRFSGETFIIEGLRNQVREHIGKHVRAWDAIFAFGHDWRSANPAQAHVLHLRDEARALLPAWPVRTGN